MGFSINTLMHFCQVIVEMDLFQACIVKIAYINSFDNNHQVIVEIDLLKHSPCKLLALTMFYHKLLHVLFIFRIVPPPSIAWSEEK